MFEPSSSPASAEESESNESTNVCRMAALSSILAPASNPLRGLERELISLGFADDIFATAQPRMRYDVREVAREAAQRRLLESVSRVVLWETFNASPNAANAYDMLLTVLESSLERESTAAAVAIARDLLDRGAGPVLLSWVPGNQPEFFGELPNLFPENSIDGVWDPAIWQEIVQGLNARVFDDPLERVRWLVAVRLQLALLSGDHITRSLASTCFMLDDPAIPGDKEPVASAPGRANVSTMIHGTNAWQGTWWRPGQGDFHDFVLNGVRRDLYQGGARFGWNGYLRDAHRTLAARDLRDWARDLAPYGLHSVFAHSYGADVAAKAWLEGLQVDELVLLSAPVNAAVRVAAAGIAHVVDVRLPFDPVLAGARLFQAVTQWLPHMANVSEVLLAWSLDHSASHSPSVWLAQDVAARGDLV